MNVIEHRSPNHNARPPGVRVDTVLLHHTGTDAEGRWSDGSALHTLCNPAVAVSAHYLVETTGRVLRLVPEGLMAWHAGWGKLPWEVGEPYNFNRRSVGIEVVNPGDGKTPFTEAQYLALEDLVPGVVSRFMEVTHIRNARGEVVATRPGLLRWVRDIYVLGHRDVAPGRKVDPADNFDWSRIYAALKRGAR